MSVKRRVQESKIGDQPASQASSTEKAELRTKQKVGFLRKPSLTTPLGMQVRSHSHDTQVKAFIKETTTKKRTPQKLQMKSQNLKVDKKTVW